LIGIEMVILGDTGEYLGVQGTTGANDGLSTYTQSVTVPSGAIVGLVKMRILAGNAWTYTDEAGFIPATPCGDTADSNKLYNVAIKDFGVEIGELLNILLCPQNHHLYSNQSRP
jgi:hypothetical protein